MNKSDLPAQMLEEEQVMQLAKTPYKVIQPLFLPTGQGCLIDLLVSFLCEDWTLKFDVHIYHLSSHECGIFK